MKPWLKYTIIRLALFAGVLALLLVIGVPGWIAAVSAALVGLAVSYIFFRPQRDAAVESVIAPKAPTSDEDAE